MMTLFPFYSRTSVLATSAAHSCLTPVPYDMVYSMMHTGINRNITTLYKTAAVILVLCITVHSVHAVSWLWPPTDQADDYSCVYDFNYYVSHYSDVKKHYKNDPSGALRHFLDHGMAEGRQAKEDFSVMVYRRRYPDIAARYGNDLKACFMHYVEYGYPAGASGTPDEYFTSTQLSELRKTGNRAFEGDEEAQEQIISFLGGACAYEWQVYGFLPSVLIAQVIYETGWCSDEGSVLKASDNNILGMNLSLINWKWKSPWSGRYAWRRVPQFDSNNDVYYTRETMRRYADVEECIEDYAAFKTGLHPEISGSCYVEWVIRTGLRGYSTDQTYFDKIRTLIRQYNLTRFDHVKRMPEIKKPVSP